MSEAFLHSGVPEVVFRDGFNDGVTLAGGTRLQCEVSQDRVSMVDLDYVDNEGTPCYLFVASTVLDACADSRTLSIVIRTEHAEPEVKKHPDLRAGALIGRTIRYFDEEGPRPLTHFVAYWDGESEHLSTNYNYFRNEIDRLAKAGPVSDAQRKEVALASWTGEQIRKHGFRTVQHIEDTDEWVEICFARSRE